jgi:hypothetical protein
VANYFLNQEVEIYTPEKFEVGGVATDPGTVTLVVKDPSGTRTTYTYAQGQITRVGTGDYKKAVIGNLEGDWYYWWYGTGACAAAYQGWFTITDLLA